ncbi:MAG: ribonuclease R [Selenomonadales bacterium]|nr:ribonuclease R [Selenomonadales bacterium]
MTIEQRLLALMAERSYRPKNAEKLAGLLGLGGDELNELWRVLDDLLSRGTITENHVHKYGLPQQMNQVVGQVRINSKGFGFVIADDSDPSERDIHISADKLHGAMNNDRVVAHIDRPPTQDKAGEGEIVRIIERANKRIVGVFHRARKNGFVTPLDSRIREDIFISAEAIGDAQDEAHVVVELTVWPTDLSRAEGRIVEILGYEGDVGLDILDIIKKHDLPLEFPQEVQDAADKVPETIDGEPTEGRRDCRSLTLITIDGEDAKDLDDAVYVERTEGGNYRLGVYIADVSYYVREGRPLDTEAYARGTSVYLADRVIPMLPKRLSNGICSLNAGVDRFSMAAEMEYDPNGRLLRYEIFPAIIQVRHRMTYTAVNQILVEKDETIRAQYTDILPMLETMEKLRGILRNKRMVRGAIDFDLPEVKVVLSDTGKPTAIKKRVRNLAESIIEEFMLAANETVAEHMERKNRPFLYRVHELPDSEKLERLNNLLYAFGKTMPKEKGEIKPIAMQKVLASVAGEPEERIVSTVMLRSMKQARYSGDNLGHFGLAAEYYTHFTSPIRRYPDLIVHRLLREDMKRQRLSKKRREELEAQLPEIAEQTSIRERVAAEAEKDTVELKLVEYMSQFIGEEFDGTISGVTAFGIFVELENGVEGLVRMTSLTDDYYLYAEDRYMLIGERTGKTFRLGDPLRIIVDKTDIAERTIDFLVVGMTEEKRPAYYKRRTTGKLKQLTSVKPNRKKTKDTPKRHPADDTIIQVIEDEPFWEPYTQKKRKKKAKPAMPHKKHRGKSHSHKKKAKKKK